MQDWTERMKSYNAAQADDWPFWYTERSNCSMLAAAAWKTGIALEEFDVDRHNGTGNAKGRCDLWVRIGEFDCAMEFKQIWPSCNSRAFEKSLGAALRDAKRQIKTLPKNDRAPFQFAGCFVVPTISSKAVELHRFKDFVARAANAITKQRSVICAFGIACSKYSEFTGDDGVSRTYTGVILIGEFV